MDNVLLVSVPERLADRREDCQHFRAPHRAGKLQLSWSSLVGRADDGRLYDSIGDDIRLVTLPLWQRLAFDTCSCSFQCASRFRNCVSFTS